VNSKRENYPYGEVNNPSWTSWNGSRLGPCSYPGYTGTAFEPIDAYKGDFARNYFYMATRYLGEDAGWLGSAMADGAVLTAWAEEMLICWHLNDPVSTKELDRNEAVYDIQNNRNPFIDHPEYVLLVYDPTSVEGPEFQYTATELCQNVPNPFTSSTTIRFVLPEATSVSIAVYDVSGRLVDSILQNGSFDSGYHDVIWDCTTDNGEPAGNGIYFCRLITPDGSFIRSMLLLGDSSI
jgi:hypothetical protein